MSKASKHGAVAYGPWALCISLLLSNPSAFLVSWLRLYCFSFLKNSNLIASMSCINQFGKKRMLTHQPAHETRHHYASHRHIIQKNKVNLSGGTSGSSRFARFPPSTIRSSRRQISASLSHGRHAPAKSKRSPCQKNSASSSTVTDDAQRSRAPGSPPAIFEAARRFV
jgi:hypothetical protein